MKRHITTLAIEISAESSDHRDFLAKTIAQDLADMRRIVTVSGHVTARVTRVQVKRSRPVRRGR